MSRVGANPPQSLPASSFPKSGHIGELCSQADGLPSWPLPPFVLHAGSTTKRQTDDTQFGIPFTVIRLIHSIRGSFFLSESLMGPPVQHTPASDGISRAVPRWEPA